MSKALLDKIEDEVDTLSEEDKFTLLLYLEESLTSKLDDEMINDELEKRLQRLKSGEDRLVDGDSAIKEIETYLNAKVQA